MELTHEFSVAAPVEQAWAVLLDVERIAPCMPGAALASYDGAAFTGTVKVKLGPVSLTYTGKGRFVTRDEANRTTVIEASGKDSRGKGTAAATVTATLHPSEDGGSTRVNVTTKLNITGSAAQFGRGMIADVSGRLIGQFANCLSTKMSATEAPEPAAAEPVQDAGARDEAPITGEKGEAGTVGGTAAAEPEPIDLLAVSGAKRFMPYALAGLGVIVFVAVLVWVLF